MTNVTEAARLDFESRWLHEGDRPHMCNAKDLVSGLNTWLQGNGHRTVSARALSSALRADEIADEMARVIARVEEMVSPTGAR